MIPAQAFTLLLQSADEPEARPTRIQGVSRPDGISISAASLTIRFTRAEIETHVLDEPEPEQPFSPRFGK